MNNTQNNSMKDMLNLINATKEAGLLSESTKVYETVEINGIRIRVEDKKNSEKKG